MGFPTFGLLLYVLSSHTSDPTKDRSTPHLRLDPGAWGFGGLRGFRAQG